MEAASFATRHASQDQVSSTFLVRLRSMDGIVSPLPARALLESPLLFKFPVCSPCRRPSAFGFVADGVPLPRPPRPLNWPDELPCPAPRPLDPGGGVDRPLVVPPP